MGTQENTKLIKKLYEQVYCHSNANALDELCSSITKVEDPSIPFEEPNLQHLKQLENEYNRAFPDKKTTIDDLIASDNKVVVCWTCTGTNKGSLMGLPPTNKPIQIKGISCYTIENGKITEITQCWDTLGLLQQLGGLEVEEAELLH